MERDFSCNPLHQASQEPHMVALFLHFLGTFSLWALSCLHQLRLSAELLLSSCWAGAEGLAPGFLFPIWNGEERKKTSTMVHSQTEPDDPREKVTQGLSLAFTWGIHHNSVIH